MPNNIQNITLTANEWVDLYSATGIAPGTAIAVENIGSKEVYLSVNPTQPPKDHDAYNVLRRDSEVLKNTVGDPGAWAFCQAPGAKVAVRAVESEQGFYPEFTDVSIGTLTVGAVKLQNSAGVIIDPATSQKQQELIDNIGAPTDAAATGDGTLIAITKRIRDAVQSAWNITKNRFRIQLDGQTKTVSAEMPAGNSFFGLAAADQQLLGPVEDISDKATVSISIKTDQSSAANGAVVRLYDKDMNEIISPAGITVFGTLIGGFAFNVKFSDFGATFFQIDYKNGPVAANIQLQVTYYPEQMMGTILPLAGAVTQDTNALVTKGAVLGQRADGSLQLVPVTDESSLQVSEEGALISPSGTRVQESIQNHVNLGFSPEGFDRAVNDLNDTSVGGTLTQRPGTGKQKGGALFSTGAAAGNSFQFESKLFADYDENTAQSIIFNFTKGLLTPAALTGDAFYRVAIGHVGTGNRIAFGQDATGVFFQLMKNNENIAKTYQADWNADKGIGQVGTKFVRSGFPEAIDFTKMNFFQLFTELLYAAEQRASIKTPRGLITKVHTHEFPNFHDFTSFGTGHIHVIVEGFNDTAAGGDLQILIGSIRLGIVSGDVTISGVNPDGRVRKMPITGTSSLNSTTDLLTAGTSLTFDGVYQKVSEQSLAVTTIDSDKNGTLTVYGSLDGVSDDVILNTALYDTGDGPSDIRTVCRLPYLRIEFTSDADQTRNLIHTKIFQSDPGVGASPIGENTSKGRSGQLVQSAIKWLSGNVFVPVSLANKLPVDNNAGLGLTEAKPVHSKVFSTLPEGATPVTLHVRNQSTTQQLRNITGGKTFFLVSYNVSFFNVSLATRGEISISDGLLNPKLTHVVPSDVAGVVPPWEGESGTFRPGLELQFTDSIQAVVQSGNLNYSIMLIGYEI